MTSTHMKYISVCFALIHTVINRSKSPPLHTFYIRHYHMICLPLISLCNFPSEWRYSKPRSTSRKTIPM